MPQILPIYQQQPHVKSNEWLINLEPKINEIPTRGRITNKGISIRSSHNWLVCPLNLYKLRWWIVLLRRRRKKIPVQILQTHTRGLLMKDDEERCNLVGLRVRCMVSPSGGGWRCFMSALILWMSNNLHPEGAKRKTHLSLQYYDWIYDGEPHLICK